jgi:hypothetical protein
MKTIIPIVLLLIATLGCGLANRFANVATNTSTSNSSTQQSGDSVSPTGDPKQDVIQASKKFLDLPQFSAKMDGQGKTALRMDLEYQAPDRFHMTGYDAGTHAPREMIWIGKDMYVQNGGRWQKIPNAVGTSMPNLKKYFDQEGLKSLKDVKFDGDETLDGKLMRVYSYRNDQVNTNMPFPFTSKIWVGSADGLPHKIEVTYEQGDLKTMTVDYDYDKNVDIQPPV